METIHYLPGKTRAEEESVLALGFFDGMHLGHRALLALAKQRAQALGHKLAVFTFPAEEDAIKKSALRLYDTKKKLSIFDALGVDTVYICELSAVANIEPKDFVYSCLATDLRAHTTVCGFNYRFGYKGAGDAEKLKALYKSDRERLEKYAKILYAEACLISGVSINNPAELCELISELMI